MGLPSAQRDYSLLCRFRLVQTSFLEIRVKLLFEKKGTSTEVKPLTCSSLFPTTVLQRVRSRSSARTSATTTLSSRDRGLYDDCEFFLTICNFSKVQLVYVSTFTWLTREWLYCRDCSIISFIVYNVNSASPSASVFALSIDTLLMPTRTTVELPHLLPRRWT